MVVWRVYFSRQAQKDAKKISKAGLRPKVEELLRLLEANPFSEHPPYEKLVGDLQGFYSRRINIKHRMVYQILKNEKVIKVLRLWTHYGD